MIRPILTLLLTVLAALPAAAQEVLTLQKCLEQGLERNYDIRIVRNESGRHVIRLKRTKLIR